MEEQVRQQNEQPIKRIPKIRPYIGILFHSFQEADDFKKGRDKGKETIAH